MKVRLKTNHSVTGYANKFNPHGLGEIIVGYDDGDMSSEELRDYQVQLSTGVWVDMDDAFKQRLIVPDNYDQYFAEPTSDEAKKRGWND